jgi:hypothetical protein
MWMPYRDRRRAGVTLAVEIIEPRVRARAAQAAAGLGSLLPACVLMDILSPVAAAGLVVGGAALGAVVRKMEPYLASSIWITVEEDAQVVRVERVAPGSTASVLAAVPLTEDVHFVVTGRRTNGERFEVVELRRGEELLVEAHRHPDDLFHSLLFAHVDREVARVNAAIQACTARTSARLG